MANNSLSYFLYQLCNVDPSNFRIETACFGCLTFALPYTFVRKLTTNDFTNFSTIITGPILGVSPLDQPLVNFGSLSLKDEAGEAGSVCLSVASTVSATKINGNGRPAMHQQQQPSSQQLQHHQQPTSGESAVGGGGCLNDLDSRNFTLSPETTDCDSADLESEMSVNEGSFHSSGPRMHTAMPVLEDGLSSGHASDLEDDIIYSR